MQIFKDDHLSIDGSAVCCDSRKLVLTRKEFELLAILSRNEGEIIPRPVLLETVWGYRPGIRTRTLDVHIRRLRRKLGVYGDQYIQTVFGVGYRFERIRPSRPLRFADAAAFAIGA